jgi:hypothetical protein
LIRLPVLYDLLAGEQLKARNGTPEAYYLFDRRKRLLAGPANTRAQLFTPRHRKVPPGGKVLAVPQNTVVVTCVPTLQQGCPGNAAPGTTYYYLFKHDLENKNEFLRIPEMTGCDLKASGTQADTDQLGQPAGDFRFADARRADHDDVLGRDVLPQLGSKLLTSPTIADGDGNRALGRVLPNDVTIESGNSLPGGHVVSHGVPGASRSYCHCRTRQRCGGVLRGSRGA